MSSDSLVLRLGASATLSGYVLPVLLASLQRHLPGLQVQLRHLPTGQVADCLRRGELDLGFVEGLERCPRLHYEHLLHDELVAVRQATPGGPPPRPLPLAQVLAGPLALREPGSGTLACIEQHLRQAHGVELAALPQVRYLPQLAAIKERLLAAPGTIGLLPRRAVARELLAGALEEVWVLGLRLTRPLVSVRRPDQPLPPAAARLLILCRERYGSMS